MGSVTKFVDDDWNMGRNADFIDEHESDTNTTQA